MVRAIKRHAWPFGHYQPMCNAVLVAYMAGRIVVVGVVDAPTMLASYLCGREQRTEPVHVVLCNSII